MDFDEVERHVKQRPGETRRLFVAVLDSRMMFRGCKFENQRWCIGREQAAAWRAATGGAAISSCRLNTAGLLLEWDSCSPRGDR
jgi:hypothetical protein